MSYPVYRFWKWTKPNPIIKSARRRPILNEKVINEAFELGLIENNDKNIQRIEEDCLVVLSVPSLSFAKAINTVKKSIPIQKVVFTDTLSAKSAVLAYLESDPDLSRKFILSHPIAGSEKSGLANSTPSLFKNNCGEADAGAFSLPSSAYNFPELLSQ